MTMTNSRMTVRALSCAAPLTLVALLSACELDAVNPGRVQAATLEDRNALPALVNGAGRDLAEAINWTAYTGGAVAREIHPAGSTAAFGISVQQQAGKLVDDDGGVWWDNSQRVCAQPILISDITGRVIADPEARAEALKALGRDAK